MDNLISSMHGCRHFRRFHHIVMLVEAMPVEENAATAQSPEMQAPAMIERVELYQIEGGAVAKAPNAPSAEVRSGSFTKRRAA